MENILLEATYNTPLIDFNSTENTLVFEGRSIPEHANMFYQPLIDWIKEYVSGLPIKTEVTVKIDYMNSSSHKFLMELFEKLEPLADNGKDIVVNWFYEEDDDEMRETGIEYKEIIQVPFKIIEVEEF